MTNDEEKLFEAIRIGNNNIIAELSLKNVDINVQNNEHLTPMMLACKLKNKEAVEILINQVNIDITRNDGDPNHFTALMHYMAHPESVKDSTIVDVLFDSNKLSDEDAQLAFIYYASVGNLEKVKKCLSEKKCDINYQHGIFDSVLLAAVKSNQIEVVQLLLAQSKININCTDYLNRAPLHLAIENGYKELITLLLTRKDLDLHIQSYLLGTPLTAAIFLAENNTAMSLIDKEAQFQDVLHPRAFLCAVEQDAEDILEKLIEKGANIYATGEEGYQKPDSWVWEERSQSPFIAIDGNVFAQPLTVALEQNKIKALHILQKKQAELERAALTLERIGFFAPAEIEAQLNHGKVNVTN